MGVKKLYFRGKPYKFSELEILLGRYASLFNKRARSGHDFYDIIYPYALNQNYHRDKWVKYVDSFDDTTVLFDTLKKSYLANEKLSDYYSYKVEYKGKLRKLIEVSRLTKIPYWILRRRCISGMQGSELLSLNNEHQIKVSYKGKKVSLKELSSLVGIPYVTLYQRYVNHKDLFNSRVIKTMYNGKLMTIAELADISGLSRVTIWCRYKDGKRGSDLTRKINKIKNPK